MRLSLRKYWTLVACLNYVACLEGHSYCDRSELTPFEAVACPARAAHNSSIVSRLSEAAVIGALNKGDKGSRSYNRIRMKGVCKYGYEVYPTA